jgi:hypothetical protein
MIGSCRGESQGNNVHVETGIMLYCSELADATDFRLLVASVAVSAAGAEREACRKRALRPL